MPQIDSFRNLLIVPFRNLVDTSKGGTHAQGGPVWPAWTRDNPHRHHKSGQPIDHAPVYDKSGPITHAKDVWWAGACCDHFGHQVVDFSSKLALYGEMLGPDEKICIATKTGSGFDRFDNLPGFARAIYSYFDFGPGRIHIVTRPTKFTHVHSIAQQEQHGGYPATQEHLAALERFASRKLRRKTPWRGGRFYISRARMPHGGGIAGEGVLEHKFQAAGYQILHPETMSLHEQLEIYNAAHDLVFQEGSALHGLQLLGRIKANVTVLTRRPGFHMLQNNLQQRVSNLRYIQVGEGFLHGLKPNGQPADANGLLIPDQKGLEELCDSLGLPANLFANLDTSFETDIEKSISDFLSRENRSHRAKNSGHLLQIKNQLAETRFGYLLT